MDLIEVILIVTIILVIVIDFFIKKRKQKTQLKLIGDDTIEYKNQNNYYHIKNYIKQYFFKIILVLVGITLIVTNPDQNSFKNFYVDKAKWIEEKKKIKEKSKFLLRFNFFFFSIHQESSYESTFKRMGEDGGSLRTVTEHNYIGIFNSFHLISSKTKYITY